MIFIDTETTGLDPKEAVLSSIAALYVNKETFKIEKELYIDIDPLSYPGTMEISDEALKIQGVTLDDLVKRGADQEISFWKFEEFLKECLKHSNSNKLQPAGYNIQFDLAFLENWADVHTYPIRDIISYQHIDLLTISRFVDDNLGNVLDEILDVIK